jgi:hypothetical protein
MTTTKDESFAAASEKQRRIELVWAASKAIIVNQSDSFIQVCSSSSFTAAEMGKNLFMTHIGLNFHSHTPGLSLKIRNHHFFPSLFAVFSAPAMIIVTKLRRQHERKQKTFQSHRQLSWLCAISHIWPTAGRDTQVIAVSAPQITRVSRKIFDVRVTQKKGGPWLSIIIIIMKERARLFKIIVVGISQPILTYLAAATTSSSSSARLHPCSRAPAWRTVAEDGRN